MHYQGVSSQCTEHYTLSICIGRDQRCWSPAPTNLPPRASLSCLWLTIKTMLNGGKQETNSLVAYLYLLPVLIVIVSSLAERLINVHGSERCCSAAAAAASGLVQSSHLVLVCAHTVEMLFCFTRFHLFPDHFPCVTSLILVIFLFKIS